jgi:hypothetical protein
MKIKESGEYIAVFIPKGGVDEPLLYLRNSLKGILKPTESFEIIGLISEIKERDYGLYKQILYYAEVLVEHPEEEDNQWLLIKKIS